MTFSVTTHNSLVWILLHDVDQLLFTQKLRDSKLVPLVPITSRCSIHAFLLRFRECVVQHFFARGSTSEKNIGALSRVSAGFEDCHRFATLRTKMKLVRQHQNWSVLSFRI